MEGKHRATGKCFFGGELASAKMTTRQQLPNRQRSAAGDSSAGHQDRQVGLAQDRACDATEYQLVQAGVAVGAHDEEIGAERGGVREQNAAHVLAAGRQASYLQVRVVTRQVSRDVRSRLLA